MSGSIPSRGAPGEREAEREAGHFSNQCLSWTPGLAWLGRYGGRRPFSIAAGGLGGLPPPSSICDQSTHPTYMCIHTYVHT